MTQGNGSVAVRIDGEPMAQGSMKAFVMPNGHASITHSNKTKLRPWRDLVAHYVKEAWGDEMVTGKVVLHCLFRLKRPKSHYGQGGKSMTLRPSAPPAHLTKPDLDKLVRAINDALTGVIYRDDSQVCETHASKIYAELEESTGVVIIIETEPAKGGKP
jgi:Holliday junction resolvase RusA-like endonuclease